MHQAAVFHIALYSKYSDECSYSSPADAALHGGERNLCHSVSRNQRGGRYHGRTCPAGSSAGFGRSCAWRAWRRTGDAFRAEGVLGRMGCLDAAVLRGPKNYSGGGRCTAVAVWNDWERRSADFECTSC